MQNGCGYISNSIHISHKETLLPILTCKRADFYDVGSGAKHINMFNWKEVMLVCISLEGQRRRNL
jgi:hypothetical protein